MRYGYKHGIAQQARNIIQVLALGILLIGITSAVNAATINGSLGVGGSYGLSGNTLTLDSVLSSAASGDISLTVDFFTPPGTINNGVIDIASFTPITDVFVIGGWQFDMSSLVVNDNTSEILTMSGTGSLSGNGFDTTSVVWGFSGNTIGSSYSMTITAVPVPAAIWLFGSGLFGLVGLARRKAA